MSTVIQFVLLFLLSSVKFVVGIPSAFKALHLGFFELILFGIGSGFTGVFAFMFFSNYLFAFWDTLKRRIFPVKKPKKKRVFNRFSRIYVKVIRQYGLAGIAFITPTLISIPVGTLLARRLFPDRKKVLLYLCISIILWSITLSVILHFPKFISSF